MVVFSSVMFVFGCVNTLMTGDNRDAREAQSPGFPSPEMISDGKIYESNKTRYIWLQLGKHIHLSPLLYL